MDPIFTQALCAELQFDDQPTIYERSFTNNLWCRFCDDDTEETQEHLEVCTGCENERRGQNMSHWKGRVVFWRRVTAKIGAWGGDRVRDRLLLLGGTLT